MNSLKDKIINAIIDVEGGYIDDPADSGGETNYGITVKVARDNGYMDSMRDMPRSMAFDIYAARYWDAVCGDLLATLAPAVAEEVVDTAVNMGVKRAGQILQRALNALNDRDRLYSNIVTDGKIGPATINALKGYMVVRDEVILMKALNCLQGAAYIALAERRKKDERFLYGWLRNRVTL